MKTLALFALVAAGLITGCAKKDAASTDTASTSAASTAIATPTAAPASGPHTFELSAGDNMKYDVTRIEAAPGEEIKVVLTNKGTAPKQAMGHNFILLKAGSDAQAFVGAAVTAAATDYIPASKSDEIIAHTKLLGPKESDEVTFKAPTQPGEYTYLCSFPGHYLTGMKGVLVVK